MLGPMPCVWGGIPQLELGSPGWSLLELWLLSLSVPGRPGESWCPRGSRMPMWRTVKEKWLSLTSCSSKGQRGTTNVKKDMWSIWGHPSCQTAAGRNFWWGHLRWTPPALASAALSSYLTGTLRLDTFLCAGRWLRVRKASNNISGHMTNKLRVAKSLQTDLHPADLVFWLFLNDLSTVQRAGDVIESSAFSLKPPGHVGKIHTATGGLLHQLQETTGQQVQRYSWTNTTDLAFWFYVQQKTHSIFNTTTYVVKLNWDFGACDRPSKLVR